MEIIITIFNETLYRPLFNALIWLYNNAAFSDLGIAIIILTIGIRFLLFPLSKKSIQSQKALNTLQPKIKEVQKKYKNKEEQAQEMMKLYRKNKINPVSGCLPILIQLPFLLALFRVFHTGLEPEKLNLLYGFITRPAKLDSSFLGLLDLAIPSLSLAIIAGFLLFVQAKMMLPKNQANKLKIKGVDFSSIMGQQMTYFMPILTVFIAMRLPAALALYWIVITLFGIIQQHLTQSQNTSLQKKHS